MAPDQVNIIHNVEGKVGRICPHKTMKRTTEEE